MPQKHIIGDEIEVAIERIVPRGFGIGFGDKLTVFVALAAPGDRLRVRLTEVKKRIAFAEIVEILEPGPDRVAPPCPYFGVCGGCDFQQLSYEAQVAAKIGIIRDCLRRIAKIDYDGEIAVIPSPKPLEYRTRARWIADREMEAIGYRKRASHEVVDVDHCPILVPSLDGELGRVRSAMSWDLFFDSRGEIESTSGESGVSTWISDAGSEPATVSTTVAAETFRYSAQAFFQANASLAGDLIKAAIAGFSGGRAVDLYCGVGLFSLPLARMAGSVVGVEENPVSSGYARESAAAAGLTNLEFVTGGVGRFLRTCDENLDLILLDPPRSGTEDGVIEQIAALRPRSISYVSCDPAILARDLEVLTRQYGIDSITALDLFPQSHHIETVARLSLR